MGEGPVRGRPDVLQRIASKLFRERGEELRTHVSTVLLERQRREVICEVLTPNLLAGVKFDGFSFSVTNGR